MVLVELLDGLAIEDDDREDSEGGAEGDEDAIDRGDDRGECARGVAIEFSTGDDGEDAEGSSDEEGDSAEGGHEPANRRERGGHDGDFRCCRGRGRDGGIRGW